VINGLGLQQVALLATRGSQDHRPHFESATVDGLVAASAKLLLETADIC
jgi:hypothetical protein